MFEKISVRLEKYSERVTESGCQIWTGAMQRDERGVLRNEHKKLEAAHRLSYRVANNLEKIENGLHVLHRCDVGSCINPNHLFLGTALDNMHDMDKKGRRGAWHPFGKLNPNYKHGKMARSN